MEQESQLALSAELKKYLDVAWTEQEKLNIVIKYLELQKANVLESIGQLEKMGLRPDDESLVLVK